MTAAAVARAVWAAGVAAAHPSRLLRRVDLEAAVGAGPVRVLAVGKAALGLAEAARQRLGVAEGVVVGPEAAACPGFEVVEAGHPVPTEGSLRAGWRARGLAAACRADGLPLLVLLSGGASALLAAPVDGLALADLAATTDALLRSGASIDAVNAVRKHLSAVKGGRLAAAAAPARVVTLAVSDVVGDDPATIGSGPAVPDPTTFADALAALDGLDVPAAVRAHLRRGVAGEIDETPAALSNAYAVVIGSVRDALDGARAEAERLGWTVSASTDPLVGEARDAGGRVAGVLRAMPPGVRLWGGETTVTVRGDGRGGRNQEAALAAALALDGAPGPLAVLFGGTDGVDGPTPAAGAVVTEQTASRLREGGLDPTAALDRNDSHGLWAEADRQRLLEPNAGLLCPGPTGTNVMDLTVAVRPADPPAAADVP